MCSLEGLTQPKHLSFVHLELEAYHETYCPFSDKRVPEGVGYKPLYVAGSGLYDSVCDSTYRDIS